MTKYLLLPLLLLSACVVPVGDESAGDDEETSEEATDTTVEGLSVGVYVGKVAGFNTWCKYGQPLVTSGNNQHCPALQTTVGCVHVMVGGKKLCTLRDFVRYGTYSKEGVQKYFDNPGPWKQFF